MLQKIGPPLALDPNFLARFDKTVPDLKDVRDYEEHFDDYSLGKGRNKSAKWGNLESYAYDARTFTNGLGHFSTEAAQSAARTVWEAVISMESRAKEVGYLSYEDRYESKKMPGERS
jgi:hypothetical protein